MLSNATRQIKDAHCLDDFMIAHRNKVLAAKAWYREKDCHCNQAHLAEFKAGFMQGYADVANGSNGCVPLTAPSEYWGWRYQSPDGQAAVNAWFAGYPLGAKAAEQDGVGNWGMIRPMGRHQYNPATAEAPAMMPMPMGGEVIYGPDGTPIGTETIVPGSERIVPNFDSPEIMEMEYTPSSELLEPAMPTGTEELLNSPGVADEASLFVPTSEFDTSPEGGYESLPSSNNSVQLTLPENGGVTKSLSSADTLVPQHTAQSYSLNDLGEDQGDDDAIPFKFE
ncbi:hypothetical protein [Stieleria tagensis]|uniref:hypothetical protein n=1 Tax=Stieleria tagensis TaxID=2956795 RepID=UPI00209A8FBC|nr:hypothetical protein [Stieleria tagensis]